MLSIRDLAQQVGYSFTTVSRALKDDPAIRASTRKKIREAADRLGYRPNALVQGVTRGRTRLIAMIGSNLASHGLARQFANVSDFLRGRGYPLIALNSNNDLEQEQDCFRLAVDYRVSGVILHSTIVFSSEDHFKPLIDANIPFVFAKEYSTEMKVPHIYRDDQIAINEAVTEAVAYGHRHFAHIAGDMASIKDSNRLKCYRRALAEFDINLETGCIFDTDWMLESAERATMQLFGKHPQTTFIFAANDEIAFGVYRACNKLRKRIPEDVSVLGSGDMQLARALSPALSTINPKAKEIGATCCEVLFELIEKPDFSYTKDHSRTVTVKGEYIGRSSIGPVRKG